ncbi:EutN/CcmL family microcompartment protein [Puniceicoccaceae bacterium K14]|nr:EutN/CcmL family microcompartment protein [Puniceicoccaceae bacterium K14]
MRFGKVVGNVVLNHALSELEGSRWILVKPMSKAQFADTNSDEQSNDPSLVVYDRLGAKNGDVVGFTEGGEAMLPFEERIPIDAYNAIIVERVNYFGD